MDQNSNKSNCISPPTNNERIKIKVIPKLPIITRGSQTDFDVFMSADEKSSFLTSSEEDEKNSQNFPLFKYVKLFCFLCLWLLCCCALMTNNVKVPNVHQISVPKDFTKTYLIWEKSDEAKIKVTLQGALVPHCYENLSINWMDVWVQMLVLKESPKNMHEIKQSNIFLLQNVSDVWNVPLVSEELIGVVPEVTYHKTFKLFYDKNDNFSHTLLAIKLKTNLKTNFPVTMSYNLQPIDMDNGIIYAAILLVGLYFVIIFDFLHRTLAAIFASTISIAVLAWLNAKPTMSEIISWIDVETLLLLFSMMTLVTILGETGIFDYMSVLAYKTTNGKIWPLINSLCIITAVFSCFLDNVTTTLLITPVTIKLCEVMKLNPIPVLLYMLIFANIGGAITPIGDPPNVIIASNPDVMKSGINFGTFTLHMGVGSLLAAAVVYIQLRCTHKNVNFFRIVEPSKVEGLKREIAVWQRAAASVSSYTFQEEAVKETLIQRSNTLRGKLKSFVHLSQLEDNYSDKLQDLEKQYPIRDKVLLVKSGCTLLLVICVFFLHSIPFMSRLGLGWTALLGALLLLLLHDSDKENIEGILSRVEWSTLLFFASLFILMEALTKLGLIDWVGLQTQNLIMSVNQESRLTVAIILILWVSGIASAFVDNLPLTTMMIKIATNLADNRELGLPLQPLIWALSFGACFGGNGSLFGSTSNIICAGVAEQHGYRFSFLQFAKIGLPVMITSMTTITIYLIVCHVMFNWN